MKQHIDLDKEEFLKRLDIRIFAISGLLEYHEKYIASIKIHERNKFLYEQERIERTRRECLESICKLDKEIQEYFEKIKNEVTENKE